VGKKQKFWPAVAVGPAVIFIIQRGNYGFAGAGGGNNKVFKALAVFALYLERFKDTRLVGMRRGSITLHNWYQYTFADTD